MTTSTPPHTRSRSTLGRILAVFGVLVLGLILAGFFAGTAIVRGLIHGSNSPADMAELRSELLECLDVSRTTDIEVTIPGWIMTLGRVGASLSHLDPEARVLLETLRSGRIGVYELSESPGRESRLAMLETADAQLLENGDWNRIVTLIDNEELVVVYTDDSTLDASDDVELFVIVMDHRDFVMASARANAEPVLQLASSALEDMDFGSSSPWLKQ